MRGWRWLTRGLLLLLVASGLLGAMTVYAQPFAPTSQGYAFQQKLSSWVAARLPIRSQATLALRWLERHGNWLAQAQGSPDELLVLASLDEALLQSARVLSQVPERERGAYLAAWGRILTRIQPRLATLSYAPAGAPDAWKQVQEHVRLALELSQPERASTSALRALAQQPPALSRTAGAAIAQAREGSGRADAPMAFAEAFAQSHTAFPLTGGHAQVDCSACHIQGRFAGTSTSCQECHQNRRPANHWQGECSACHSTSAWRPANFRHTFPIQHGGANGQCGVCHPGGSTAGYTCVACHALAQIQPEHQEEGIFNIAGRCAACHMGGGETNGGGVEDDAGDGEEQGSDEESGNEDNGAAGDEQQEQGL